MAENQLRKAFELMKQGQKQEAARICQAVLKQDRENVQAWWMMANVLDDPVKKEKAAQRVLQLNPDHAGARKLLGMEAPAPAPRKRRQVSVEDPEPRGPKPLEELDFSKLEAREARKNDKAPSEDQAIKLATYGIVGLILVALIIAAAFFVLPMLQGPGPEAVVGDFIDLTFSGDIAAANNLVCLEQRLPPEEIPAMEAAFSQFTGTGGEFDMSGLTFDVISQSGDTAQVTVAGGITVTGAVETVETSVTINFNELGLFGEDNAVTVIREDGEWRICEPLS